jgi:hypothetical protein
LCAACCLKELFMGPRRTAMLLMLAAGSAGAQPAAPPTAPAIVPPMAAPAGIVSPAPASISETGPVKRVFIAPALQWDNVMSSFHPAAQQTASAFSALTGGVTFGMSPSALNAVLPEPYPGLSWASLALANEYPGEARMFGIPVAGAGALRMNLTACAGTGSYVVFLFKSNGLFRISYRLTADRTCTDTNEAAQQIFARYVPLGRQVAFSVRYRTGRTWVVDITDPAADYMVPVRWRQAAN